MKRFMFVVLSLCGIVMFGLILTGLYLDVTDPRPRGGSPECETAQVALFNREPNHSQTPAEFINEVNEACK